MTSCSKEIKAMKAEKDKCEKGADALGNEIRKLVAKLQAWEQKAKEAKKKMDELLKANPWIASEKTYFGCKDSDFDFENKDVEGCQNRLKALKSEQDKLSKKINKKVMGMLQTAEDEYNDLNKKRQVSPLHPTAIRTCTPWGLCSHRTACCISIFLYLVLLNSLLRFLLY
jgi:structural maintenance of chromosome 2